MATYGSPSGVNALVPSWDGSTSPTAAQVTAWLGEGYAKINRAIAGAGYTVPVDDDAAAVDELTGLENLYAAAYLLRSQAIDTASGQTEERSEVWLRDFYSQLADLVASDLTLVGASLVADSTSSRRRRIRTLQMRRVDGYSGRQIVVTDDMDFQQAVLAASQGEYTSPTMPSE